jgi:hypothetical protein
MVYNSIVYNVVYQKGATMIAIFDTDDEPEDDTGGGTTED